MNFNDFKKLTQGLSQEEMKNLRGGNMMNMLNNNVVANNQTEAQVESAIEIKTESQIKDVLALATEIKNDMKAVCASTKREKLNLLLSLKVKELSLNFTSKIFAGDFEADDAIEKEIKETLPKIEKLATNLLNKIKNKKLKQGKSQDKAYLLSMKTEIMETLAKATDVAELKLMIRGLYMEAHHDLGLPEIEAAELKNIINEVVEALKAEIETANIKEETLTLRIAERLNKLIKFYDNGAFDLDDLVALTFKKDVDAKMVMVKGILYKITGESKYL